MVQSGSFQPLKGKAGNQCSGKGSNLGLNRFHQLCPSGPIKTCSFFFLCFSVSQRNLIYILFCFYVAQHDNLFKNKKNIWSKASGIEDIFINIYLVDKLCMLILGIVEKHAHKSMHTYYSNSNCLCSSGKFGSEEQILFI